MRAETVLAVRDVPLAGTYVLPIAAATAQDRNLSGYLARIARTIDEVIVVDGSPPEIFAAHQKAWAGMVRHLAPARRTKNGKVGGVLTGVQQATHERIVLADDDVRYRRSELERMLALLATHAVVRPQNHFHPLPWHARWDTGRSLLNRIAGGDWPGTLGIRRSVLLGAGGYSGDVLFENLELVRTVKAAGGKEAVPLDLFVVRRPPAARHFLSQRVRQAYDEWARPGRFATQLAIAPALFVGGSTAALAIAASAMAGAEIGRQRAGGRDIYSPVSSLWAPLWMAERSITSWLALGNRLFWGGMRYRSGRLRRAATPEHLLRERIEAMSDEEHAAPSTVERRGAGLRTSVTPPEQQSS